MPNQNDSNQISDTVQSPSMPVHTDLPPVPDFSASSPPPSNFFPPNAPQPTNRKFGKKQIIATFLGLLLLVGGVSAGIVLTIQPQLFNQKAAANCCRVGATRSCSTNGTQRCVFTDPENCVGQVNSGAWGACVIPGGGGGGCITTCVGKTCSSTTSNGCGVFCTNGTGCNYCSNSQTTACLNYGGCVPNSNGGVCASPIVIPPPPTCGTGLNCQINVLVGGYACNDSNNGNWYCCNPGKVILSSTCVNPGECATTDDCANGYACVTDQAGHKTCQPTGAAVGGAPTACTPGRACASGDQVCEPPSRLECKTLDLTASPPSYKWCLIQANSPQCGGGATNPPAPTPPPTPTPTPTRSPSPTPTRSPSPTPIPQCNSVCTATSQCLTGQTCSIPTGGTSGNCRNPSCTAQANCLCPTPTPSPSPSPSPGPTAVCTGVKAYDSAWNVLSAAQLAGLKAGNNINFCVTGTTNSSTFDMARFTINTVTQANTTVKRPTTNDYCQAYTIPANVYTFNVTAQIHHVILGWVGP